MGYEIYGDIETYDLVLFFGFVYCGNIKRQLGTFE